MLHRLAGPLVAALLVGALPALPAAAAPSPSAVVATSCSAGFVRARVGGSVKCLHAGEYCARRYHRAYRRHHFKCVRIHGIWRLEER